MVERQSAGAGGGSGAGSDRHGAVLTKEALLEQELVKLNLRALEAGKQHLALRWLIEAPSLNPVTELTGDDGRRVILVSGQSQSSRRDPVREARQWLDKQKDEDPGPGNDYVLFGLGNPWAAGLLLQERPLSVFEPEPLALLAVFSRHDFSANLSGRSNMMRLLTPWHLAEGEMKPGSTLLIHPPAQRRALGQLSCLKRILHASGSALSRLAGRGLKVMVVAPISGGSWPVAASLARAVEAGPHELFFLQWDDSFRRLETEANKAVGKPESGKLAARLFERAGQRAAQAAASFQPDLVIALAQAPLDGAALARLREHTEAFLAFWLVEDFRHFAYVAEVAPAYDFLFHIQKGGIEKALKNWGIGNSAYMPLAADPSLFKPIEAVPFNYRADLSFMGAGYPNRRNVLGRLAEAYWPRSGRPAEAFKIFGSGWDGAGEALTGHLFEGGRRVSLAECALIYAGGQVNLNLHSSFSAATDFEPQSLFVNPRTFEIAASASFQIIDARPLLPELFEAGQELITVSEAKELPDVIDHYLKRPDEARAIGAAARERVLIEHSYDQRLKEMLAQMGWSEKAGGGDVKSFPK